MFELITLEDVMKYMNLGPNGALMYCMEFLEKNLGWLDEKISKLKNHYFLFDCPGQVTTFCIKREINLLFLMLNFLVVFRK